MNLQYACRKTLADSRPRVRGRFAKNDELEMARNTCSIGNHEEDTDEDVSYLIFSFFGFFTVSTSLDFVLNPNETYS